MKIINEVFAQGQSVNVPAGQTIQLGTLEGWISTIANSLVYLSLAIAVIFIIWGGITYMFAGGDAEKAGKAKTRLWNGIIGAIIIFGVGMIIKTIQAFVQGSFFT